MVFRHKAPVTAIYTVVAIVTHFPIVVHTESIAVSHLAIDKNLVTVHLQCIMLIVNNSTTIKFHIARIETNSQTFGRYLHRSKVIHTPLVSNGMGKERETTITAKANHRDNGSHCGVFCQLLCHGKRQRQRVVFLRLCNGLLGYSSGREHGIKFLYFSLQQIISL